MLLKKYVVENLLALRRQIQSWTTSETFTLCLLKNNVMNNTVYYEQVLYFIFNRYTQTFAMYESSKGKENHMERSQIACRTIQILPRSIDFKKRILIKTLCRAVSKEFATSSWDTYDVDFFKSIAALGNEKRELDTNKWIFGVRQESVFGPCTDASVCNSSATIWCAAAVSEKCSISSTSGSGRT